MRAGHSIAIAIACGALAGCGGAPLATESTVPDTTPHGSPPQTLLAEAVEKERSQRGFEQSFRTKYVDGSEHFHLLPGTIRFRTPCEQNGAHGWRCEGWSMNANKKCLLASATVSGAGVVGSFETMVMSSSEAGYAVCANGSHEGQPFGDLNPEP